MPGRILVDTTPLRESRDFRLLFTGQLISTLGTQLTVVAIPYQVYRLTHSSLQVGAISLAQLVPLVARARWPPGPSATPWTGARSCCGPRWPCRSPARCWPSTPWRATRPCSPSTCQRLAAGLDGFSSTARTAAVPALVEARHISAASAFTQIVMQVGTVVGPALSGLLLTIGLPLVYGLDAVSFVAALVATLMMAPIPRSTPAR